MINNKYRLYLTSKKWKKIRSVILNRDFWCVICWSNYNINIHHKNYEYIYKERFCDLVVLCENCHNEYHILNQVITKNSTDNFILNKNNKYIPDLRTDKIIFKKHKKNKIKTKIYIPKIKKSFIKKIKPISEKEQQKLNEINKKLEIINKKPKIDINSLKIRYPWLEIYY
jgi:hypothetical protein